MHGIGSLKYLKPLSLGIALAVSACSHASTITFNLVDVNTSDGTLTGTVEIDTVTKLVTSADITFNYLDAGSPVFTSINGTAAYNGIGQAFISGPSNSPLNFGGHMALYFDTANLGLGNLDVCVRRGDCGLYGSPGSYAEVYTSHQDHGPIYVTSGELDAISSTSPQTAATPEPPSLILLGTGILLGAAMLARFSDRKTPTQES